MKIVVYAICKDEEQFVDRWMDSMSEADEVVVLDTGSSDATAKKLRDRGAKVIVEKISPWRFDVARNRSMELIPKDADICVCTDLDEVFVPGWRAQLEKGWHPGAGQARFRYTWSFGPDGSEGVVFWYEKIHTRNGYRWVHPVHEVLKCVGEGTPAPTCTIPEMQLNHYPDPTKSRKQYLPLLELSVQEDPDDDRNMHYLGREYMYNRRWKDSIRVLEKHLAMKRATWPDERCASMRYIARCYLELGERKEAEKWYLRSIAEAPYLREPWLEYAQLAYEKGEWYLLIWLTEQALTIRQRPMSYICEADSWGMYPYDLASLGYYHIGQFEKALEYINCALMYSQTDERLLGNRSAIYAAMGCSE